MALNYQIIPGKPARPKEYQDNPVGYEQKAVSGSAVGFASIPYNATNAVIVVEDATIRWRDDGTNTDTNVGTKSFVNTTIILKSRKAITNKRAIKFGTTDAKLSIN